MGNKQLNLPDQYQHHQHTILLSQYLIKELIGIIDSYVDSDPIINGKFEQKIEVQDVHLFDSFRKFVLFHYGRSIVSDGKILYLHDPDRCTIRMINADGKLIDYWPHGILLFADFYSGFVSMAICNSQLYILANSGEMVYVFNIPKRKLIDNFVCHHRFIEIDVYKSHVYLLDDVSVCYVYTLSGKLTKTFTLHEINTISGVRTIYPSHSSLSIIDDYLYVGTATTKIVCFSINGEYKFNIDGKQNGGREFIGNCIVYATRDSLYICDQERIQQFNRFDNFRFVKEWGENYVHYIDGIAFADNKCFVTAKGYRDHIFVFI